MWLLLLVVPIQAYLFYLFEQFIAYCIADSVFIPGTRLDNLVEFSFEGSISPAQRFTQEGP